MTGAAVYENPALIIVAWGVLILLASVLSNKMKRPENKNRPYDYEEDDI